MKIKIYKTKYNEVKIAFLKYKRVYSTTPDMIDFFLMNYDNEIEIEKNIIKNSNYIYIEHPGYYYDALLSLPDEEKIIAYVSENNILNIISDDFIFHCNMLRERINRKYIGLFDYGNLNGKSRAAVSRKIHQGDFLNAKLVSNNIWIIPENTLWKSKYENRINQSNQINSDYLYQQPAIFQIVKMEDGQIACKIGETPYYHIFDLQYLLGAMSVFEEEDNCTSFCDLFINNLLFEKGFEKLDCSEEIATIANLLPNELINGRNCLSIYSSDFFKWLIPSLEEKNVPYVTTSEFANKYGKTTEAVRMLIRNGRLDNILTINASNKGKKTYLIPSNAEWPQSSKKKRMP